MPGIFSVERVYEEVRNGFGPDLCRLMDSEGWSDIMVNPNGEVFIDTDDLHPVEKCRTDENGLWNAALTLAAYGNLPFNDGKSQHLNVVIPVVGYRANFTTRPAVIRTSLTIRRPNQRLMTLEELLDMHTITKVQMRFLQDAVTEHKNIILSGGTGSGKTSLTNSLITIIDPKERLICIEDVKELMFSPLQKNVYPVLVNRDYSYQDAIADSLRQRPTRIIIGECRFGNQAMEMLKAWNTGHPGGISTIHADNSRKAIERLDQLCSEVSVSSQMPMIRDVIDVVVQMERVPGSRQRIVSELYDNKKERMIS